MTVTTETNEDELLTGKCNSLRLSSWLFLSKWKWYDCLNVWRVHFMHDVKLQKLKILIVLRRKQFLFSIHSWFSVLFIHLNFLLKMPNWMGNLFRFVSHFVIRKHSINNALFPFFFVHRAQFLDLFSKYDSSIEHSRITVWHELAQKIWYFN